MTTRHGVLMAMYGRGVLLTGDSGTGKSELALQLIRRGHALVADDAPEFEPDGNHWTGRSSVALRGRLQLRGVGVIDVPALLGGHAIRDAIRVDLLIHLTRVPDTDARPLDGSVPAQVEFLGQPLPQWSIPVDKAPASPELIELAVRSAGLADEQPMMEPVTWN